jgi:hypothetical protein
MTSKYGSELNAYFASLRPKTLAAHHIIVGEIDAERKRPEDQEEAEVQELRGQRFAEKGRQGGAMSALRRDRGEVSVAGSEPGCLGWE